MYQLYCHTVYKGTFETYQAAVEYAASIGVVTQIEIIKVS